MCVKSNLRSTVKSLIACRFPGPKSKALSIVLRFSNNIFGAHAWMSLARKLNLNRPRKQRMSRKAKQEVEEEPITAMPPVH